MVESIQTASFLLFVSKNIFRHSSWWHTLKRMNRTLIEMIRVMLRTASLPNSFWAKAAKIACYIVNWLPSTTIELKALMEMWTGKPANFSYLHAFGCPVYVMYNTQERIKFESKCRR